MTTNSFLSRSVAGLMGLALTLSLVPFASQAQSADISVTAEEEVVVKPSDSPLDRQAKLERAWITYREVGSKQIWALMRNNVKREIKTLDFFTAFEANYHIQLVAAGRLSNFRTGDPITSIDGLNPDDFHKRPSRCRLMKVADKPAIYLVCNGKRRVIIREGVFHRFGWEFRDVETVSQSELDSNQEEAAVNEETVFEEEVEVDTTHRRDLREQLETRLKLRARTTVRLRLVKAFGDPRIYLIDANGFRRHVASLAAARRHGLNLTQTTEVTAEELAAFPEGSAITEATVVSELDAVVR